MSLTSFTSSRFGKTKVPEQGWITAGAWPLKSHVGQESRAGQLIPRGGAGVYDISEGDLLFSYRNVETMGASLVSPTTSDTTVFTCINGMNDKQGITFMGVATTGYTSGSGEEMKIGLTMAGTVTIKKYSYSEFKQGDLVAWGIPKVSGDNGEWDLPRLEEDIRCGRIRPVLYPVRLDSDVCSSDNIIEELKKSTLRVVKEIKDAVTSSYHSASVNRNQILGIAISTLESVDNGFHILKVIKDCEHRRTIDAPSLLDAFNKDLWEVIQARKTSIPDSGNALKEKDALYIATFLLTVIKKFVSANADFEFTAFEGDPAADDSLSRDLFLIEFDAHVTHRFMRFIYLAVDDRYTKKKHHIIGMAMNASTAQSLDVWIGRKC